jgi:hypothetical protein
MQKLTPQQEKFAQAIALEDMNQADAYRSAYDTSKMGDDTIYVKASQLASKDKVAVRIKELRQQTMTPKVITAQKRKEWLTAVINDTENDIRVRLQASDQLNRMEGAYVQKVETEIKNAVNINIELSDD